MKKYLVTGGTGFIGSALVKRLVEEGHHVRVLDNNIRGEKNRLNPIADKIEMFEADIRDLSQVKKAVKGMDSIIHLAYINGTEYFYKYPELVLDIAVKGMINVIESAKEEKSKEFVYASSSEVYQTPQNIPTDEKASLSVPDPLNPRYSYGGGKIIGELMALNYGRKIFDKTMIFRPHNIYGPDMGFEHVIPQFVLRMKEIIGKESSKSVDFPIQGDGRETRAFCFIDDFIDGMMVMLDKGKDQNIYHIGTMEEIEIRQAARQVARYFEKEINIIPGELLKGGTKRRCPDITKLKDLGYSPKVSFEEGCKVTAGWYDKNSHLHKKLKVD